MLLKILRYPTGVRDAAPYFDRIDGKAVDAEGVKLCLGLFDPFAKSTSELSQPFKADRSARGSIGTTQASPKCRRGFCRSGDRC